MLGRMNKVTYGDCILYITDADLSAVIRDGAEAVMDKPYITMQVNNWFSADYPDDVDSEQGMMSFMCHRLFIVPPDLRERSDDTVVRVVPAEWTSYSELSATLQAEAREYYDDDAAYDTDYLVYDESGTQTFTSAEMLMHSAGFWMGTYGETNVSGQGVVRVAGDGWLLARIM